jgi:hypothetical protein
MAIIGVAIIIASLAIAVWRNEPSAYAFCALGVLAGFGLVFNERVVKLTLPAIGSIDTAVTKASTDASDIAAIKTRVEAQSATIDLVAKKASDAKSLADSLAVKNDQADQTLKDIEQALASAKVATDEIKLTSEFSLLVAKASSDDRHAFDSLIQLVNSRKQPLADIALKTLVRISTDPIATGKLREGVDLKALGIDTSVATTNDFWSLLDNLPAVRRPDVLWAFWGEPRFTKYQKLDFLCRRLATEDSLASLGVICDLINKEAHIDITVLGYAKYWAWWENNRDKYKTD